MNRFRVIGVVLLVLGAGGVVLAWRSWTRSAPPPAAAAPPPAGPAAVPQPIVPTLATAPVTAGPPAVTLPPPCPGCADLPADPQLADAARRGDLYRDYSDRLAAERPADLAQEWPQVVARQDPDELPAFISVFAEALRAAGDAALYRALAETLQDPLATPAAKAAVMTLLGRAATPEAVAILIEVQADGLAGDALAETLRESIREAASALIDGQPNWDLSPVLEGAWRGRAPLTPADRAVLAQGLGELSTAAGTRALLETLDGTAPADPTDQAIAAAALGALERNEAVPVLAGALAAGGPAAEVTTVALGALVQVGSADAWLALVDHLSRDGTLDEGQRETLSAALGARGLDEEAVAVVREALAQGRVRDVAVRERLAASVGDAVGP